jgi:hypothetical protein
MQSASASSQQNPNLTQNAFVSTATPISTDDCGAVPPLSPADRTSSRSTGYESAPKDNSATVSDTEFEFEVNIDKLIGDIEIAESNSSMVDRWLGNSDTVAAEERECPACGVCTVGKSKLTPLVYVSEVNAFHEDT